MKIRRPEIRKPRIEIIPMIDVIFFLLVFFMVSSLSMSKINGIKVALPKTASSSEALKQKVILSVKGSGEIFINKSSVSLDNLGTVLAEAMKEDPQGVLLVNGDENANYGRVIQAMDKARLIGVRKFALATEPSKH